MTKNGSHPAKLILKIPSARNPIFPTYNRPINLHLSPRCILYSICCLCNRQLMFCCGATANGRPCTLQDATAILMLFLERKCCWWQHYENAHILWRKPHLCLKINKRRTRSLYHSRSDTTIILTKSQKNWMHLIAACLSRHVESQSLQRMQGVEQGPVAW